PQSIHILRGVRQQQDEPGRFSICSRQAAVVPPLNEETLFRGIMLNVFRSRYCWTMWLGALITSLLFVAAHSQYQNLLTLAELFLVGLITSVARIRSGGLLLPVLLHMEATTLGLLFG
ncbi:CPBP family intramembrane glutamic endopeptidase, partial [Klebsiella pneumoniae]